MATGANYKVLIDVEVSQQSLEKSLKEKAKGIAPIEIKAKSEGLKETADGIAKVRDVSAEAAKEVETFGLTFNVANEIFEKSTNAIKSLVSQIFELDSAMIEFRKVSHLQGGALDNYIGKLNELGSTVARTGKPSRSEPVCYDGKVA